jgi:hypothetical protein
MVWSLARRLTNSDPWWCSYLVLLLVLGSLGCGQKGESDGKAVAPNQPAAATPANVAPKVIPAKPITGGGKSVKAVATFHDDAGPSNLAEMYMVINTPERGVDGTAACAIQFQSLTDDVYLLDDTGHKWLGPHKIHSSGVISNSQCTLDVHDMALAEAGGNLEWTVSVTFAKHFYGPKSIFAKAINKQKLESNFALLGSWTANSQ